MEITREEKKGKRRRNETAYRSESLPELRIWNEDVEGWPAD